MQHWVWAVRNQKSGVRTLSSLKSEVWSMKSEAGRSQDFFRGTHNSPNRGSKIPVPPLPHFSNGPSLSNDDGEGNENVPSYLNECMFDFSSLEMANIGELPYGVLGTAPKFGLREEIEFVPVLTSSKQRRKRKFNVVFVQVVKKSPLLVIYLLGSFRLTLSLLSPSPSPSSLLRGFIDVRKESEHVFRKKRLPSFH